MLSICALIVLINIIFYLKSFQFKYVSDDIPSAERTPEKNPFLHYLWVVEGKLKSVSYKVMKEGKGRPLYLLPFVDHLITTIIHSLVCVGIYLSFGHNNVSFLAAILFAVNPINSQGAVWISGRGYALSALGMVWALAVPWEMGWPALLVAMYSNAGFLMPIALLGSGHPQLLFFAPFIWAFYAKNFVKNVKQKMDMESFDEDKKMDIFKAVLAFKTFGFYVVHSVFPIKHTFYHSFLESLAGSKKWRGRKMDRFFWCGVITFIAMLWYVTTHRWDIICFAILWWCVGIAPFINIRRMQQEISERYCYLPNVGMMVVLSAILSSLYHLSTAVFGICAGGFVAMYAMKMWLYMDAYKDDFWLIEYSTMYSPDSWFAWNARAHSRMLAQSFKEAQIYWVIALNISPNEFKLLMNIAATLFMMGPQYHAEGLQYVAKAEQNMPAGQEKDCKNMIANFRKGQINFSL